MVQTSHRSKAGQKLYAKRNKQGQGDGIHVKAGLGKKKAALLVRLRAKVKRTA